MRSRTNEDICLAYRCLFEEVDIIVTSQKIILMLHLSLPKTAQGTALITLEQTMRNRTTKEACPHFLPFFFRYDHVPTSQMTILMLPVTDLKLYSFPSCRL